MHVPSTNSVAYDLFSKPGSTKWWFYFVGTYDVFMLGLGNFINTILKSLKVKSIQILMRLKPELCKKKGIVS